MKYIRTKDKIFTNKNPKGDKEVYTARYREEDIIAQADTIEELCDEIVVVVDDYPVVVRDDERIEIWKQKYPSATFYGAIWTSKGLIYVAKMNDKGELEEDE